MNLEAISKEDRLLLCSTRKVMDENSLLEMKNILAGEVDWDDVFKNGGRHGILSLLYCHLKDEQGSKIPSWVL